MQTTPQIEFRTFEIIKNITCYTKIGTNVLIKIISNEYGTKLKGDKSNHVRPHDSNLYQFNNQ